MSRDEVRVETRLLKFLVEEQKLLLKLPLLPIPVRRQCLDKNNSKASF